MSHEEDHDDSHNRPPRGDGPQVIFLSMPCLAELPPDSWFEDEEGERAVARAEQDRQQRLRLRGSGR